jgi:hypothetical protein
VVKKLVLLLVLGAGLATTSANAQQLCPCPADVQPMEPRWDVRYTCDYSNPWFNEVDPGWAILTDERTFPQVTYGIELYQAQTGTGRDNRRIAFALLGNTCRLDRVTGECNLVNSVYQFSVVAGPQCSRTVVRDYGHRVDYDGCDNGKRRTCTTY